MKKRLQQKTKTQLQANGTMSKAHKGNPEKVHKQTRSISPLIVCLSAVISIVTILIYFQVSSHNFITFDDPRYVYENPQVVHGLTLSSIHWAFTTFDMGNWHPVTWLSHMLDCQLFGLHAEYHHLVNLFLHIINILLLFIVLVKTTKRPWRSFFVAAIFAIHPLHVESVAWIAERKDVLSAFFGIVSLLLYVYYVEKPSWIKYCLLLLSFALSLMAKPMLVTFPFVLLLLDVWPLKRCSFPLRWKTIGKLLQEKVPLLVLVIIDCILTFNAQHFSGAVSPLEGLTLTARLANTFVSYIAYIEKAFLPINLALLYPLQSYTAAVIAGSFILFTAITAACCFWRKKHPYLIVGWLWYAGMLVPVIGLVQVGVQSMADRYTYLPMIGLSISIIWLVSDWIEKRPGWKNIVVIISAFLFIFWGVQTYKQLGYWKSSQSLYEHTLAVTSGNYLIHTSLGSVLSGQNRFNEAIDHFNAAIAINPNYAIAHYNLGVALFKQGNVNEAITHYQAALAIDPNYAEAHHNWGLALAKQGNTNDAITHFRLALAINPNYVEAHNYLGAVLSEQGNNNEAIAQFKEALAINPAFADAHNNWGLALAKQGDMDGAITQFRLALVIKPDFVDAHNNLGTALAQQGNIDEAITHFRQALAINPNLAGAQSNLARALASQKRK